MPTSPSRTHIPRLVVVAALVLVAAAASAALVMRALGAHSATARARRDREQRVEDLAIDTRLRCAELRRFEKDVFLNLRDPESRRSDLAQWGEARRSVDADLAALVGLAPDSIDGAPRWLDEYASGFESVVDRIEDGTIRTAEEANDAMRPYAARIRELDARVAGLADSSRLAVSEQNEAADALTGTMSASLVVAVAGMGALAVALGLLLRRFRAARAEAARALAARAELGERERLQQDRARQKQKMDAIGRLAGGMAHDFNNILTVIAGYGSLAMARLTDDDPLRQDLVEIRRAGERAVALTNQLLAFSRRQILAPEELDLNTTVANLEVMLGRLAGDERVLRTRLAPDLGRVRVDPGRMEQVIVNLVANARDASPPGGLIRVETTNVVLDSAFVEANEGAREGDYVRLAVRDEGAGMDEATKARIFEPFFTTKGLGRGSGLGLATLYGFVKQSDGYVTVESEPGRGSTFSVFLPRVDAADADTARTAAAPVRGTERVLVVEDEDAVRSIARITLESAGFDVRVAASGAEALADLASGAWAPDLLLADVVMPGMTGREVADRLVELYPALRLLFMSGHAADELVRRSLSTGRDAFVAKPFTPDGLLRAVREALDTKA